ncbi:MAG TPA: DnaJ domain-containing protein [Azospirillaceae bacterium]|nr:DnaJ domain-containing protein [Azospirillaceae bacterium]
MFPLFLLAIALVVGLWLLARSFVNADPRMLAKGLRYGAVGLGVGVVVFLALSGRLGLALTLGAFVLPLISRWRALLYRARAAYGPSSGQTSSVDTQYLHMELHHDSGRMDGDVVRGRFAGRRLDAMTIDDLIDLLREVRNADPQSAAVLEAYMDRARTEDWRARMAGGREAGGAGGSNGRAGAGNNAGAGAGDGASARPGMMSRDEAYNILGLQSGATPEQVKEAHRRLMQKVHPDHGGSTYLAAKINQAKDLLLRG